MEPQMLELSNIHIQMFLLTQSTLWESWFMALHQYASSYNWIITIPSSLPIPRNWWAPLLIFSIKVGAHVFGNMATLREDFMVWNGTYMMNYLFTTKFSGASYMLQQPGNFQDDVSFLKSIKFSFFTKKCYNDLAICKFQARAPTHTRALKEASKYHN